MLQSLKTTVATIVFFMLMVTANYFLWSKYVIKTDNEAHQRIVYKVQHHYHGIKSEGISQKLVYLAKELAIAKRHARSQITQQHLNNAFSVVEDVMEYFNATVDPSLLKENDTVKAGRGLVCPEEYKGTKFGYPYYNKGWEVVPCDAPPLSDVITILLNMKERSAESVMKVLKGIQRSYPTLPVHIALDEELTNLSALNMSIKTFMSKDVNHGKAWNNLLHSVKTPYLLVGRDLEDFDSEARIERQIRVAESLSSTVVGGAVRQVGGKWAIGCHQFAVLNYTLAYVEGYDVSRDSCVYCEHISGPFVARTDAVQKESFYWFDEQVITRDVLFEDLFMRIKRNKQHPMICPDSMYYVRDSESKKTERTTWLSLVKKWGLNLIRRHGGQELSFGCAEAGVHCDVGRYKGMAIPICCLESGAIGMNALFKLCDREGFVCETDSGSLIGTVKLNGILPWDIDGDIAYNWRNHSGFRKNRQFFESQGMRLIESYGPNDKVGGYYALKVNGWNLEMWGMLKLGSEDDILSGRGMTKIYSHGYYHGSMLNPGKVVRNRYGHNVYRHTPHWRHLGSSTSWMIYNPSTFTPCPKPGHHACLDQFMIDGNLQFKKVWL